MFRINILEGNVCAGSIGTSPPATRITAVLNYGGASLPGPFQKRSNACDYRPYFILQQDKAKRVLPLLSRRNPSDGQQVHFSLAQVDEVTWLIRENDVFGEYPHIYARLCSQVDGNGNKASLIVLNDTGVGTTAELHGGPSESLVWNIRKFIEYHLNPSTEIPCLIILSHCHYDHILGLRLWLPSDPDEAVGGDGEQSASPDTSISVMASSFQPSFLTPFEALQEHSLCKANQLRTPHFAPDMWAPDQQRIMYKHKSGIEMVLPIITIHTPGHTPDSLSWYDIEARRLYVGDSLYQQETDFTRHSPWGPENAAPIIFPNEGNILQWWRSVEKLQALVEEENVPDKSRVTLAAGHVTATADAGDCLKNAKEFMATVLRGDACFRSLPDKRGKATGHWALGIDGSGKDRHEFSVVAPLFVIDEGRVAVPKDEWSLAEA